MEEMWWKKQKFTLTVITPQSVITLNLNGLNSSTRHRLTEWILKNRIQLCTIYKRPTSDLGTHIDWKWGNGKRYSMQMDIKRKLG